MTDAALPKENDKSGRSEAPNEKIRSKIGSTSDEDSDIGVSSDDVAAESAESSREVQPPDGATPIPERPPKERSPRSSDKTGARAQRLGIAIAIAAVLVAAIGVIVTYISQPPRNATEDELRSYSKEYWGDVRPTGSGPWRMLVVAGSEVPEPTGLRVWSSPREDAVQVGSVGDRQYIWARCRIDSRYDPFPGAYPNFGSVWYGISWPNNQPGRDFYNSSRNDQYVGYVWEGAVVAWGQNSDFPNCP